MAADDYKINVALTRQTKEALDRLTLESGKSKTEMINDAVRLRDYVRTLTDDFGSFEVIGKDGNPIKVVLL